MPMRYVVLALVVCATAFAQSPVASIAGVVKDPSGAVVAGAGVTSTSLADAGKRRVISDEQGFFLIPTLMPGEYQLVVEARVSAITKSNASAWRSARRLAWT